MMKLISNIMESKEEVFFSGSTVKKEIEELHHFFELWFTGKINEDDIERFIEVLDDDFQLIAPNGASMNQEQITSLIIKLYNNTKRTIWVENIETRVVGTLVQATYHEYQQGNGTNTKRISSALFKYDPEMPNYARWLHVHETWVE